MPKLSYAPNVPSGHLFRFTLHRRRVMFRTYARKYTEAFSSIGANLRCSRMRKMSSLPTRFALGRGSDAGAFKTTGPGEFQVAVERAASVLTSSFGLSRTTKSTRSLGSGTQLD